MRQESGDVFFHQWRKMTYRAAVGMSLLHLLWSHATLTTMPCRNWRAIQVIIFRRLDISISRYIGMQVDWWIIEHIYRYIYHWSMHISMISYWLISNISIHSWLSWGITRFGTDMEGYHQGHPALQFQWRQPGHLGGCQPNASWRGIETTSSMGLRTEKCWGMIFERSVYINI